MEKGVFWSPSTKVANFTLYIYILRDGIKQRNWTTNHLFKTSFVSLEIKFLIRSSWSSIDQFLRSWIPPDYVNQDCSKFPWLECLCKQKNLPFCIAVVVVDKISSNICIYPRCEKHVNLCVCVCVCFFYYLIKYSDILNRLIFSPFQLSLIQPFSL